MEKYDLAEGQHVGPQPGFVRNPAAARRPAHHGQGRTQSGRVLKVSGRSSLYF